MQPKPGWLWFALWNSQLLRPVSRHAGSGLWSTQDLWLRSGAVHSDCSAMLKSAIRSHCWLQWVDIGW
jgi:hypothetical protein